MTVLLWVAEMAAQFWQSAGPPEPFPCSLRRPLARALPLGVIFLPGLCLDAIRGWLQRRALNCPYAGENRTLRACLYAHLGTGFIFLDGTDPKDEQRFSLAHELAHFLLHYWQSRQLACRQLGEKIVEVLDGFRAPTDTERLHGLLKCVSLGSHCHLLERDERRHIITEAVAVAEEEADLLAYELLAPAETVFARLGREFRDAEARPRLTQLLSEEFGLPLSQAESYGYLLLPEACPDPVLLRLRHQS